MYPYQVDPHHIPRRLDDAQLEYFILFAILVAGKKATQTHKKLNDFLERNSHDEKFTTRTVVATPFEIVRMLVAEYQLRVELEASKFGQYSRIAPAMALAADLDLSDLSLANLESIPGIGPKTARYIMLYAVENFDGVPLDTHILKYLNERGYRAPKTTPPAGPVYDWLENKFRIEAINQGLTIRELDTKVWKSYSNGEGVPYAGTDK